MKKHLIFVSLLNIFIATACRNDSEDTAPDTTSLSEEYYAGGKLGTTFNETTMAYEQPTPAVERSGMMVDFRRGESLFEQIFVTDSATGIPGKGLGPVYVRSSCIACHPGYGHGRRVTTFNSNEQGNGYLLCIYHDDGTLYSQFTGMPQTRAVAPYVAPINESGISIQWLNYTDEYGNRYPDGEQYELIYPQVSIAQSAILFDDVNVTNDFNVSIESTIGIYGTGLLDAIDDADLIAEATAQQARGYCVGQLGNMITDPDGTTHPGRYTYGLTRGTLQNGPGANAIWNITNVTRNDRRSLYITGAWATKMEQLGIDTYANLMRNDHNVELERSDYDAFMIWHRGLAVPAARNLDNAVVKRGRQIFYEIGCTACHKPSWTTGADNYKGDPNLTKELPRYPYQKIYPYTDLLKHDLDMKNPGLRKWCRTTPLWGRGLSRKCTGASDHLHDMRARNYEEAILWHFGQALQSREKFRNLSKADRTALVSFLEAI
ncbi:MAG: c-type cytochrome [Bacteroidales bacterium]|jgi:CxxC motif-containing protein (DUF1111 family)|nr:c-type cytochrome [Bacteroidales bacterium]